MKPIESLINWIKKIFNKLTGNSEEEIIPTLVNDFNSWSADEQYIGQLIDVVREEFKPLSRLKKVINKYVQVFNKVPDLVPNKDCREEALGRVNIQIERGFISHDGVEVSINKLENKGYNGISEILAFSFRSPESVVEAWYNSETHRRALMNSSNIYYGVAQKEYLGKKFYCVFFVR